MSADPERVRSIFDHAVDLPLGGRAAYVAQACAGDASLAAEVAELLRHDATATTVAGGGDSGAVQEAPPLCIGRFEVLGKLGEGGMGVVYRGHDRTLGREVALKLMRAGGHGSGRARLLREAQAMARVAHPNVVPIYEAGLHNDDVFFAMELVHGATLAAWLSAEPRLWREVLALFVDAGRGLAAAHDSGILHRDFKPENVIVGDDGRARVLDFGLARSADEVDPAPRPAADVEALAQALTRHGAIMGTPAYMSPEHFEGDSTARSDQWSFAVALYRGLFGGAPFSGDNLPALREAVLAGEARAPAAGEVPAAVVDAVARGMARQPDDRFASLAEMLAVFEQALGRDPELDLDISRRQRRWLSVLAAVLGGASVAVVGYRTDFRYDYGVKTALVGGALGMGFVVLGAVWFRRALQRTAHNRRVVLLLFTGMAVITAHRALALHAGAALEMMLRTDALFAALTFAAGAVFLERWFAYALALMLGYLGLSLAFPALTAPGFPMALVSAISLGIWFWRDRPTRAHGFASSTNRSR